VVVIALLFCSGSADLARDRRWLARVINDYFIARYLAGAFAGGALIAFRASADSDAGGTFLHFEHCHLVSVFSQRAPKLCNFAQAWR
jgi:hypothetical protein